MMSQTVDRKKVCLSAFLAGAMIAAGHLNFLAAQTEAEAGPALAAHLKADDSEYQELVTKIKDHSFSVKVADTYEFKVVSQNIVDCSLLISAVRQQLYGLDLNNVKVNLERLDVLLQATKSVVAEDASIAANQLKKDSVINEFLAPGDHLPDLNGPALRAAIASELSFTERMLLKARVNGGAVIVARLTPERRTPCTDVQVTFFNQATEAVKSIDNLYKGRILDFETYLGIANKELRLLNYSNAQKLTYLGYTSAQEAILVCPEN